MKKTIIILCLVMVSAFYNDVKAQSDGFFNSGLSTLDYRTEDSEETPRLPRIGTEINQPAPLGSGVLLLSGLGIAYLIRKKRKE